MARTFNGSSDQLVCSLGDVAMAFGTWAAILQRASGASGSDSAFNIRDSAANRVLMGAASGTAAFEARFAGTITAPTITIPAASGWIFIAAAKATGTSAVRFFKYVYATDTWTIEDGSTTGNASTTATQINIGHRNSDQRWQGDLGVMGIYGRKLADSEIEQLPFRLLAWQAANPDGLWLFDQAATSQKVVDLSGASAHESTLTGTSVSTSSIPLFSYGHEILIPDVAAAGGDITATPDQGAATAAGQTPTVVATSTPDQGAATAAGQTPTAAHVAAPDQGASTAAGQTPTVAVVATPDTGAATADANAPTLVITLVSSPDQGAATAAGQTPTVAVTATPDQGAATAAGSAPTPAVTSAPDQGAATAAGQTPTVAVVATPDQGAATADAYAPTIVTGGGAITAEPDQGAATADGQTPTIAVTATPSAGAATADGNTPTVAIVVTPSTGEATADGYAPTIVTPITATPDVGEATADSYPPTILIGGQTAAGMPVLVLPHQARELAEWAALELDDEEAITVLALALTD